VLHAQTAVEILWYMFGPLAENVPIVLSRSFMPVSSIPTRTTKQEKVNLLYIEQVVDAMGHKGTVPKISVSDIAVIETLDPDIDHPSLEKKVDRLLRSRSKTKV